MSHQIGRGGGRRLRHRRPDHRRLFVAQIERFRRQIGDRVIAPGGQPIFAAVERPTVAAAYLTGEKAKVRVGNHIDPGGRRRFTRTQIDLIFAAISAKATQAIVKLKVSGAGEGRLGSNKVIIRSHRLKAGQRRGPTIQIGQLRRQRAVASIQQDVRRSQQECAFGFAHLVGTQNKDTAPLVDPTVAVQPAEEAVDIILQRLPIVGVLQVEDHQIDAQPASAPIAVGQHQIM